MHREMARIHIATKLQPTTSIVTSPRSQNTIFDAIIPGGSELINDCHLPYFMTPLPTQNQMEKAKYVPQKSHIGFLVVLAVKS